MSGTTITINPSTGGSVQLIGDAYGEYGRTVQIEVIAASGFEFVGFDETSQFVPPSSCGDIEFPTECPPGSQCELILQIGNLGIGGTSYQCRSPATPTPTPTLRISTGGGSGVESCNTDADCNDPNVFVQNPRRCEDSQCVDSVEDMRAT